MYLAAGGVRHGHRRSAIVGHLATACMVRGGREAGQAWKHSPQCHNRQHEQRAFATHTHSVYLPWNQICRLCVGADGDLNHTSVKSAPVKGGENGQVSDCDGLHLFEPESCPGGSEFLGRDEILLPSIYCEKVSDQFPGCGSVARFAFL